MFPILKKHVIISIFFNLIAYLRVLVKQSFVLSTLSILYEFKLDIIFHIESFIKTAICF